MPARARAKLAESDYHLSEIRKLSGVTPLDFKAISHCLNAFVVAARAVGHILSAEYGKKSDWKTWLAEQDATATEGEREAMRLFTAWRNESIKVSSLSAEPTRMIVPVISTTGKPNPKMIEKLVGQGWNRLTEDGSMMASPPIILHKGYHVLVMCGSYLKFLERRVAAAEAQWPAS